MARRRIALAALILTLLAASFFTILWVAETQLIVNDTRSSFVYSSLENLPLHGNQNNIDEHDGIIANDPLCGGCYHAIANPDDNTRCGNLIFNLVKTKGLSLVDAAFSIASNNQYAESCARCRPGACPKDETVYWRYDSKHKSPPILNSKVPKLGTIPSDQRVPPSAVGDLEGFFSLPQHAMPPARYLFDYNPSIIILPTNFDKNSFSDEDKPVYLSSFRVSTQQSCFKPHQSMAMYGGSWDRKPAVENFLALALLREDLSIIEDVVVDVKASGVYEHNAEDFRLFVFENTIYLGCFDFIAPISIYRNSQREGTKGYVLLANLFPSALSVAIRSFASCPVCANKHCGKNFNYFSTASNKVWVEFWPSGPHVTQQVYLDQPCSVSRATAEETEVTIYNDAAFRPPQPSWYTMEEVLFPNMEPSEALLTRERGGACCVTIEDPRTGNELLVGVYHTKIPKFGKRSGKRLPNWKRSNANNTMIATNQYLSRWYAFQPTPPFTVVAKSGFFCFGFPGNLEQGQCPLIKTTIWKTIIFGGLGLGEKSDSSLVLDCPRIHFISGMSEKANDPSKVVVAYGVNDCFSRLVEVSKEKIVNSLFGGIG